MSQQHILPTQPSRDAPSAAAGADRTRLAAAALALGSIVGAVMLVWRPGVDRGDFGYASVSAARDATWLVATIDAVASTVALIALAVCVCLLAPRRGRRLATIGAALTVPGAVLFSCGVFGFGLLAWYATDSDALSGEAGAGFLDHLEDNLGHLQGPEAVGFVAIALAVILFCVALWRAGSVPRWLPCGIVVLEIAQFSGVPGRALDLIQAALLLSFVAVAWFAWTHPCTGPDGH